MSRKKKPTKSVKIVNSIQPDNRLTRTTMPFSEVPTTVYNGEPVRPKTTPASRQIADGGSVKIYGKGL